MFKDICDLLVIIISIMMEIEIFRNLIIVRHNKCNEDNAKSHLRIARVLIVVIIVLYSMYGVVRNII